MSPRKPADDTESKNKGFFIKPKNKKFGSHEISTGNKKNSPVASLSKEKEKHESKESKPVTRPFDKKAWRFKRYSKKYKLQQWKDMRKTTILQGYDKTKNEHKSSKPNFEERGTNQLERGTEKETLLRKDSSSLENNNSTTTIMTEKSAKQKQKSILPPRKILNKQYKVDEETHNKKVEYLKQKVAREEAAKEYKRKKLEKFKKLNRKTKKGQPVMKDRIEVLLEEIQNSIKN